MMDFKRMAQNIEEPYFEITQHKLTVEFVDDISKRSNEITEQDSQTWVSLYEGEGTGRFLPWTKNHDGYILIKKNREDDAMLVTAFHEMKHALDYWIFLITIFDNDQKRMVESPLYCTFNIYSEFQAEKFGIEQALRTLNVSRADEATRDRLSEIYKEQYQDQSMIKNRFQYLVHSVQYFASLCAIRNSFENFDFDGNVAEISELPGMIEILGMLDDKVAKNLEWYQKFDEECRKFVR